MKSNNGVTLIILVITIIIMLILAGVSINSSVGEDKVIDKAVNAKNEEIITKEKDDLKTAYVMAVLKIGDEEDVTAEELQKQLNIVIGKETEEEENKTIVETIVNDEDNLKVTFNDTGREYKINKKNGIIISLPSEE